MQDSLMKTIGESDAVHLFVESTPMPRSVATRYPYRIGTNDVLYEDAKALSVGATLQPKIILATDTIEERFGDLNTTANLCKITTSQTSSKKRPPSPLDSSSASLSTCTWDWVTSLSYYDLPIASSSCDGGDMNTEVVGMAPSRHRCCMVVKRIPLAGVLERIAQFLRINSITTESFIHDPGMIRCVTSRHTAFSILLWRQGEEIEKDDEVNTEMLHDKTEKHEIIVLAVERCQGCCVELQKLKQCLRHAIEKGNCGDDSLPVGITKSSYSGHCNEKCILMKVFGNTISPIVKQLYRLQNKPHQSINTSCKCEYTDKSSSTSSSKASSVIRRRSSLDKLATCSSLLSSICVYQRRLGLEDLVLLTDPSQYENDTPVDEKAAKMDTIMDICIALLSFHDNTLKIKNHDKSLSDHFFTYLTEFMEMQQPFHDDLDFFEIHNLTVLHSLSLNVLVNTLQAITPASTDPATTATSDYYRSHRHSILNVKSDTWKLIICALLLDLAQAITRPQDAAMAARSLGFILLSLQDQIGNDHSLYHRDGMPQSTGTNTVADVVEVDDEHSSEGLRLLTYHVNKALRYGAYHHLCLENEASRLLSILHQVQSQHHQYFDYWTSFCCLVRNELSDCKYW